MRLESAFIQKKRITLALILFNGKLNRQITSRFIYILYLYRLPKDLCKFLSVTIFIRGRAIYILHYIN